MPAAVTDEIEVLYREMNELRERLIKAHQSRSNEPISADYAFTTTAGEEVTLPELFGEHDDLVVVHNMGHKCSYCTLWADGFVGLHRHLERRCAFVLTSPDAWMTMRDFAAGRGWPFRCVSTDGTTFTRDLGFIDEQSGGVLPGMSALRKTAGGGIERVATAPFGPGDVFCPLWHTLDMLPDGPNAFEPQ